MTTKHGCKARRSGRPLLGHSTLLAHCSPAGYLSFFGSFFLASRATACPPAQAALRRPCCRALCCSSLRFITTSSCTVCNRYETCGGRGQQGASSPPPAAPSAADTALAEAAERWAAECSGEPGHLSRQHATRAQASRPDKRVPQAQAQAHARSGRRWCRHAGTRHIMQALQAGAVPGLPG